MSGYAFEGGAWAERARTALIEISRAERTEQALIDALPVTRAPIEASLKDIEERAKQGAASGEVGAPRS